jgi:hypothetical protein
MKVLADLEAFQDAENLMELKFIDYNNLKPYSFIDYLPPDEFERRRCEEDGFRDKSMEGGNRSEERILKNRIERKRRLKKNV